MIFFVSIFVVVSFAAGIYMDWRKLDDSRETWKWYVTWVIRGVAVPAFVWMVFNSGLLPGVPSFSTELDVQRTFGAWLMAFMDIVGMGVFIIGSFWSFLTSGWLLLRVRDGVKDRKEYWGYVWVWSFLLSPVVGLCVWALGWASVGIVGTLLFLLLIHFTLPLAYYKPPKPTYSRAMAQIQSGHYEDAEEEVIRELEKNQSDAQGWLMLAEMYANQFGDMEAADRTIHELCQDPNTSVSEIAVALHRLADWYLKQKKDPVRARQALEEICERLSGTHLDKMARVRINSLPRTREELQKSEQVKTIKLQPLPKNIDLNQPLDTERAMPRDLAVAQANQYSEKLRKNPNDMAARENLARLMAEQLDKVDAALEQMELLLDMPNKTPQQAAGWLNLMAGWQIRFRHDAPAAQRLLERLMREFPESMEAFTAQRRLNFLRQQVKTPRVRAFKSLQDF